MSRKRKTKNDEDIANRRGSRNPSLGPVDSQPESSNPSSGTVRLQPETGSPSEKRVHSAKPSNPRKRVTRKVRVGTRRSLRVQHATTLARNPGSGPDREEITLTDSDEESDHPTQIDQSLLGLTEPTSLAKKNFGKNIAYIIQRLEAQEKTISELKSEVLKTSVSSGSQSRPYVRYRSLYIDSQKKIEDLIGENKDLSTKLEAALGKVEAYEKGNHAYIQMLGKLKDVIFDENLRNAAEAAVNMSSQSKHVSEGDVGCGSRPPVATRKKTKVGRKLN